MTGLTLLYLGAVLTFAGKAMADRVSNLPTWRRTRFVFRFPIHSYFGPKEFTANRKGERYLSRTLFVFMSDCWHTCNTVARTGIYLSLLGAAFIGLDFLPFHLLGYIAAQIAGFHIMYHWVLVR